MLHRLENLEMGERSSRVLDSFSMSKSMFLPRQKRAAGTLGTLLVLVRDPDCNLSLARSRNGQTTGLALRTSTLKEDVAVQSSEWEDNFKIL